MKKAFWFNKSQKGEATTKTSEKSMGEEHERPWDTYWASSDAEIWQHKPTIGKSQKKSISHQVIPETPRNTRPRRVIQLPNRFDL